MSLRLVRIAALKGNHKELRATIKSLSPGHPMATEPRGRTGQPNPEFSAEFSKFSNESTVSVSDLLSRSPSLDPNEAGFEAGYEASMNVGPRSAQTSVPFTIAEDAPDDVTAAVTQTEDGEPVSALPANRGGRATPAGSGAAGEEETEV